MNATDATSADVLDTAHDGPIGADRHLDRPRDAVGTELYRLNAFAVTGLDTYAQGRAVRRQKQRIDALLKADGAWAGAPGSPVAGGYTRAETRQAFEHFTDPLRRLLDEIFWWWNSPGTPDPATAGCGCPQDLHRDHDRAVRVHAAVLEAEAGRRPVPEKERFELWTQAGCGWRAVLAHPDFSKHLEHRIERLDDPRLGADRLDEVVAAARRMLVSPFEQLAQDEQFGSGRLIRASRDWLADDLRTGVAAVYEGVTDRDFETITERLRGAKEASDTKRFEQAEEKLRQDVLPALEDVGAFRPYQSAWKHDDIAHRVAIALNNLAIAMMNAYTDGQSWPGSLQQKRVTGLIRTAVDVAPNDRRDEFKANLDELTVAFREGPSSLLGPLPFDSRIRVRLRRIGWQPLIYTCYATAALLALGLLATGVLWLIGGEAFAQGTGFAAGLVVGVPTAGMTLFAGVWVGSYLLTFLKYFGWLGYLFMLYVFIGVPTVPFVWGFEVGRDVFDAVSGALG